jgi:hypothetical protein
VIERLLSFKFKGFFPLDPVPDLSRQGAHRHAVVRPQIEIVIRGYVFVSASVDAICDIPNVRECSHLFSISKDFQRVLVFVPDFLDEIRNHVRLPHLFTWRFPWSDRVERAKNRVLDIVLVVVRFTVILSCQLLKTICAIGWWNLLYLILSQGERRGIFVHHRRRGITDAVEIVGDRRVKHRPVHRIVHRDDVRRDIMEITDSTDLCGEVDEYVDICERIDRFHPLSKIDLAHLYVIPRFGKVLLVTIAKIVNDDYVFSLVDEEVNDVRAEETGPTSDCCSHTVRWPSCSDNSSCISLPSDETTENPVRHTRDVMFRSRKMP